MPLIELAILNYNGRKHLEFLLPTAVAEAKLYGQECSVVVIDNRSTEPDVDWITSAFPTVSTWRAPRNEFLFSYNEFARQSKAEILIFLNNDLKLLPDFIGPLVRHFAASDLFAVGATSKDWDGSEYTCGPVKLLAGNGFYSWPFDCKRQFTCNTLFASGGFMAVDRKKFLELGGFNRLYYPAYCEDLDLCFRAWRAGWRCLYEPRSIALHREHGSWGDDGSGTINRMSLRNSLLFQWSSLPMKKERWTRRFSMLKIATSSALRGDFSWIVTLVATSRAWRLLKDGCQLPLDALGLAELIGRIDQKP